MKHPLAGMTPEELAETLRLKPFQGRQLFQWIHRRQVFQFDEMTNLPKALRTHLKETGDPVRLRLLQRTASARTGTCKVLLALPDGETVESVLIRDGRRVTLCVSSQVGCALKCDFCATGLAGFRRNLEPAEIVEQVLYLLAGEELYGKTPNIVYMGMGEPFRNYGAVTKSIRLLMHPEGLGIGARKITLSTAGDVKGIERFAQEDWQVRLSVSLHAANDTLRSHLVPLNRRYGLADLRKALLGYQAITGRQVTFEWTLLEGVNDSSRDVRELLAFLRGIRASVNLIPWNPVPGLDYAPASRRQCRAFLDQLTECGVKATLRREKGQDIEAACGQLRRIAGEGFSPSSP